MEKSSGAVLRPRSLAIVAAAFGASILYFRFAALHAAPMASTEPPFSFTNGDGSDEDPCRGRYVYVHDLPPRFNHDMLRDCGETNGRWPDMCECLSNGGLGRPLEDGEGVVTGANGWYGTHQFALDAIFHNRMKQYDCLTNDSAAAAAIFVPFYAGFDFARHHWGYDTATRDAASRDLVEWLARRPEWRKLGGRDHFLVAGRTTWDFRRGEVKNPNWGNNLLSHPAVNNMSVLVVEASPSHSNDFAVPYPTYFHPRNDAHVFHWQERMRKSERKWLLGFVGAPRPDNPRSIRQQIIVQCKRSSACRQLGCSFGSSQCHSPGRIMRLFRSATFCLQPPGDSYTRRSAFDSMVAGCIPVFFHPSSAYLQYTWHLPKDYAKYSVFISEDDVRDRNVSIEETLRKIPPAVVEKMREEVVSLIPRLVYADPRYKLETFKDAIDVSVEAILDKVAKLRTPAREERVRMSSYGKYLSKDACS